MRARRWWLVAQTMRRLWFKATLYCAMGIVTALLAIWLGPFLPDELTQKVGAGAVDAILSIIASSMLTVTIFSLSTLVAATTAAATSATPRATSLLLEDQTAQRALSTFLGAFLFSLVGLIALNTGFYSEGGRFVLLIVTLGVVALIILTLLRWIDHLAGLGRVGETISRVERAAADALRTYRDAPLLGATQAGGIPDGAIAVLHDRIGYLQHLDVSILSDVAEEHEAEIHVTRRPGGYCDPSAPIAHIVSKDHANLLDSGVLDEIRRAFSIGDRRSFDQDPRFGLIALSEIGSRALSPGINDPGTAIDVLAALVRVFAVTPSKNETREKGPAHPRIHIPELTPKDLIDAAFMPISRDGAAMIEVSIRLQKALCAIAHMPSDACASAARRFSEAAKNRSLAALDFEEDRERLRGCLVGD